MSKSNPSDVIGSAAVKRLRSAGFDVVRREPVPVLIWECPHCGVRHAPKLGMRADFFLGWGEAWHRDCVTFYQTAPSKRGDRQPMRLISPALDVADRTEGWR